MQEGGFNIIDVSASNIVVTGPFTIGCKIVTTGGINGFISSPSLVTDADGCQSGKSFVRQTNGVWANLCSFGVSGDLAIRTTATVGGGGGTGQFINLGNGLAGNFAPTLGGSGSLAGGASFSLAFAGMPPGTGGPLFAGITQINAAFKGGILVPNPLLIISLSTGFGSINLPGSIPLNVPSNFSFYLQAWFPDLGAVQKGDATNGLRMITP